MDNNLPVETAFTLFDMLALGTIVASIAISAMRGLIAELIAFGGWLVALIFARALCVSVADSAFPNMQPREMAVVFSFVLVFVVMRILLHLLDYVLEYFIKFGKLTYLNRALGGIVGLLKGLLFVSLSVLICAFTSLPYKENWQTAKTSRFFERMAGLFVPSLPQFLGEQVVFPPRVGDANYVPPEEQQTDSGSLKTKKGEKIHDKTQKNPSSNPNLRNLPKETSTE